MLVSYFSLAFALYAASGEAINVSRLGLPFLLRGSQSRAVWSLLKKIHKVYNKKGRYHLEECSALGLKLLRTLRESGVRRKDQPESLGPFVDERIRETLAYIVENYKQRLNIKVLAERVGLHPVHYTRLFKRMMGMTPYQYLMERKIDKAKDFLRLYDEPPNAVYLDFGFHDYSHFYRTFKQRVGISPSQYVKRFRKV
jgi:AraC family transcriptional regulator